jgi:hypothetical protein
VTVSSSPWGRSGGQDQEREHRFPPEGNHLHIEGADRSHAAERR